MSIALLLAAVASGAPDDRPVQLPMPNFYRQPAKCGPLHEGVTRHVQTAAGKALAPQYAVLRTVDGCGVPAPAGYRQDYLLPGAADAPQFRRMRETIERKR